MLKVKVGDIVAIRGDLRLRYDGICEYTEDQLVLGKYIKHIGHKGIWTGIIEKLGKYYDHHMAFVGGGWRSVDFLDVMYCGASRGE